MRQNWVQEWKGRYITGWRNVRHVLLTLHFAAFVLTERVRKNQNSPSFHVTIVAK